MYRWGKIFAIGSLEIITTILLTCLTKEGLSTTTVFTGYPAMSMYYKMYVDAGKEYCVFQYAHPGSVFGVEFFVIRGGDLKALFAVKDPEGEWVLPYQFKEKASYQTENATGGYYAICTDNDSKFSTKLIGYYMATYEPAGWVRFLDDIRAIGADAEYTVKTLQAMSDGVASMRKYLHESRSLEARDHALLAENFYRIGFWSSVQFCIILVSGISQVYIIRQFFRETPSHGKYKVRL